MANISSAVGEITFIIDGTEDDLRYIIRTILNETRKFYYDTYVDDKDIEQSPIISNEPGVFQSTMRFDGNGRWAYECNVEYMGHWLKNSLPAEDVEKLEALDFTIRFDYNDDEAGCGILYDKVEELVHPAGKPLDEMENVVITETDYEYTRENLHEILDLDEDTIDNRLGRG